MAFSPDLDLIALHIWTTHRAEEKWPRVFHIRQKPLFAMYNPFLGLDPNIDVTEKTTAFSIDSN